MFCTFSEFEFLQGGALGAKPKIKRRRRRNSASIGRKGKGGAKSRGKEDQLREQRRQEETQKILSMEIPNPYYDMNIEDLKRHALSLCQRKLQESVLSGKSVSECKGAIVKEVADLICLSTSTIYKWLRTFDWEGEVRASLRGCHPKTISPIVDPDFRQRFCDYIRENSINKGEPNMTTHALAEWVNEVLGMTDEDKYGAETVRCWLHRCGFKVTTFALAHLLAHFLVASLHLKNSNV